MRKTAAIPKKANKPHKHNRDEKTETLEKIIPILLRKTVCSDAAAEEEKLGNFFNLSLTLRLIKIIYKYIIPILYYISLENLSIIFDTDNCLKSRIEQL